MLYGSDSGLAAEDTTRGSAAMESKAFVV